MRSLSKCVVVAAVVISDLFNSFQTRQLNITVYMQQKLNNLDTFVATK